MKQLNLQKQQNRLRNKFINMGVKMLGPETIYFSKDTKIGKNVIIEPYVIFGTKVKITFDLDVVQGWLTRRLKAEILYFSSLKSIK